MGSRAFVLNTLSRRSFPLAHSRHPPPLSFVLCCLAIPPRRPRRLLASRTPPESAAPAAEDNLPPCLRHPRVSRPILDSITLVYRPRTLRGICANGREKAGGAWLQAGRVRKGGT